MYSNLKNINALHIHISECKNYKSLTDSTRKLDVSATQSAKNTDSLGDSKNSVDWQGEAWYRVMDDAGTRIPEDPFTSVQTDLYRYCKTGCPGYLPRGSHPQNPGELVDNVKVCYNCNGNKCNYSNHAVKIRHCGAYFVYYLTKAHSTPMRYCTE